MALAEHNKETKKKASAKEKDKSKAKEKPPSKVIIRRLPPTMTEEIFVEQIAPIPDNDYFYYVQGELQVGIPTFSRAYINFLNQEDIFTFQDKFDGYVFLDQKGSEFPAVVEFAPYQKIPKPMDIQAVKKEEGRINTIESDPQFIEFLKKLENPEEIVLQSAESYLEQLEQKERELKANGSVKVNTPLVEFIHQRRLDREKYREEKREEKRRKEFEKKKAKEMERIKKREMAIKAENKKQNRETIKSSAKERRDEDRQPTQVKVLKNTDRESTVVQKPEKNESGAVSKRAKEVLPRPPKAERPYKEKPPAKENNRSKPKPPANERQRSTASTESTTTVGLKDETKSASINKRADVDQEPETTSRSTSGSSNPVQSLTSEKKTETERSSKRQSDRESEKEKKEKIRNKDRPTIQIYRPGAKRIITTKSSDEANPPGDPSPSSTGLKRDIKSRTFSRTLKE